MKTGLRTGTSYIVPLGYEFATHIPFLIYLYNMKKNLNEQVSRIKQMMGINEEKVNLNNYKDESSIIEDIKRVGTTDDGYPITSMKLNTFVPNEDSAREGNSVKIEVILEWEIEHNRLTRNSHGFRLRKVSSIITDVGLGDTLMKYLREKFSNQPTPKKLVENIYGPYMIDTTSKGIEHFNKVFENAFKDTEILMSVLLGDESEQAEPEVQDAPNVSTEVPNEPEMAPETEINKNNTWTSTSSWASE